MDSSTDITIDSISITGFEGEISNATIGDLNGEPKSINISGGKDALILDDDYGINDYWTNGDPDVIKGRNLREIKDNSDNIAIPTYISWGTKSNIWDDGGDAKTNHIFMGKFGTSDKTRNDPTDTSKSLKFATTGDNKNTDVTVLIPDDDLTASGTIQGMWLVHGRDENSNTDTSFNDYCTLEGTNMIDKFTKKGWWTWKATNGVASRSGFANYDARENPAFSTKISPFNPKVPT